MKFSNYTWLTGNLAVCDHQRCTTGQAVPTAPCHSTPHTEGAGGQPVRWGEHPPLCPRLARRLGTELVQGSWGNSKCSPSGCGGPSAGVASPSPVPPRKPNLTASKRPDTVMWEETTDLVTCATGDPVCPPDIKRTDLQQCIKDNF